VRKFELLKIFPIETDLLPKEKTPLFRRKQLNSKIGKNLLSLHKNLFYIWQLFWGLVVYPLLRKIPKQYVYETNSEHGFDKKYHHSTGNYFIGFRQSEKFFPGIRKILLSDFSFSLPLDKESAKVIEKIRKTQSVSIHIRRGDYVQKKSIFSHSLALTPLEYYKKAIKYIEFHLSNPTFFVFSDDIPRVKKNLDIQQANFIDWNIGEDSYKDMQLMSQCKHNIIANSSFSRRGAWLNQNPNKIVIAPKSRFYNRKNKDIVPN
jgi:hypothetical protein